MLKLLLCLVAVTAVAVCQVQLRQRRLDLAHEASQLHADLQARQAQLWDQQVRLAAVTAPPAVGRSAGSHHLDLIPVKPTAPAATSWVDLRDTELRGIRRMRSAERSAGPRPAFVLHFAFCILHSRSHTVRPMTYRTPCPPRRFHPRVPPWCWSGWACPWRRWSVGWRTCRRPPALPPWPGPTASSTRPRRWPRGGGACTTATACCSPARPRRARSGSTPEFLFDHYQTDGRSLVQMDAAVEQLARVIHGSAADISGKLSDRSDARYLKLAEAVDAPTADAVRTLAVPGVGVSPTPERYYPMGTVAAHLLGGVGKGGHGLEGLELKFDRALAGADGHERVLKDARRRPIGVTDDDYAPARNGRHLFLTVDANIQAMAEQELADTCEKNHAKRGEVVVMDPRSGDVLANGPTGPRTTRPTWRRRPPAVRRDRAVTDPVRAGVDDQAVHRRAQPAVAGDEPGRRLPHRRSALHHAVRPAHHRRARVRPAVPLGTCW